MDAAEIKPTNRRVCDVRKNKLDLANIETVRPSVKIFADKHPE